MTERYDPTMLVLTTSADRDVYCRECKQLRLWCRPEPVTACANCGSTDIVVGPVGCPDVAKEAGR